MKKTMLLTVLVVAATFASFPSASAACMSSALQNDGGRPGDAPAYTTPRDIVAGSYSGVFGSDLCDEEDWYRIAVPVGTSLRLTFTATSGAMYGGIYPDTGGDFVAQGYSWGNTVVLEVGSGVWRIGFGDEANHGTASYDFSAELY